EAAVRAQAAQEVGVDPVARVDDHVDAAGARERLARRPSVDHDHVRGAELLEPRALLRRSRDRDHLRAERGSVLDAQVTEPADADDGARLDGWGLRVADAGVHGEPRAEDRSRLDGVETVGDALDGPGIHQRELSVASVDRDPGLEGPAAELVPALGAEVAVS